jgi:hypothetical protein
METAAKIKGIVIDYNPTSKLGKIAGDNDEFYFFHRHHVMRGVPREGAYVTFLVSPKIVRDGFLKYATLIDIVENTQAGASALASNAPDVQNGGQKDSREGK